MEKRMLKGDVNGKLLFKRLVVPIILMLVINIIYIIFEDGLKYIRGGFLIAIVMYVFRIAYSVYITFIIVDEIARGITHDERIISTININENIGFIVKGALLSLITFRIYLPWFIRDVIGNLGVNLKYKGKNVSFESKASSLLGICVIGIIAYFAILALMSFKLFWTFGISSMSSTIIFTILLCLVIIIIVYFIYGYILNWLINFKFDGIVIQNTITPASMGLYIVGQSLLTIITLGIYYPAFIINMYRKLAENVKGEDKIAFGFESDTEGGFGKIFGQVVLTVITLGIYLPHAIANISNWLIDRTAVYSEPEEIEILEGEYL